MIIKRRKKKITCATSQSYVEYFLLSHVTVTSEEETLAGWEGTVLQPSAPHNTRIYHYQTLYTLQSTVYTDHVVPLITF